MKTNILKTEYLRPNVSIDICKHVNYPEGIFYVRNYKGLVWELYLEISQLIEQNHVIAFNSEDELEEYLDSTEFEVIIELN